MNFSLENENTSYKVTSITQPSIYPNALLACDMAEKNELINQYQNLERARYRPMTSLSSPTN